MIIAERPVGCGHGKKSASWWMTGLQQRREENGIRQLADDRILTPLRG
jgi:hypothetical protein